MTCRLLLLLLDLKVFQGRFGLAVRNDALLMPIILLVDAKDPKSFFPLLATRVLYQVPVPVQTVLARSFNQENGSCLYLQDFDTILLSFFYPS